MQPIMNQPSQHVNSFLQWYFVKCTGMTKACVIKSKVKYRPAIHALLVFSHGLRRWSVQCNFLAILATLKLDLSWALLESWAKSEQSKSWLTTSCRAPCSLSVSQGYVPIETNCELFEETGIIDIKPFRVKADVEPT